MTKIHSKYFVLIYLARCEWGVSGASLSNQLKSNGVTFSKLLVSTSALIGCIKGLKVGEYFRPAGDQVSGRVGASTPYVRSPCPALNSLANYGYLPRDVKNISHADLSNAFRDVYNIGDGLINLLVSRLPDSLSLADLSKHNFIEHDASLVHGDISTEADPAAVDKELWLNFLSYAKDGQLGVRQFAEVRQERMKKCRAKPTGCEFGIKQRILALGEAALLMRSLGGQNVESISVEYAKSFLVEERIPTNYKKSSTPIIVTGVVVTAGNVQLVATFQDVASWIL